VKDEDRNWNPHYKGCIWTAAALFSLKCATDCTNRCAQKPECECALLHFVQADVLKDLPRNQIDRTFRQTARVKAAMKDLVSEINEIKPRVIVVHGVPIHAKFKHFVAKQKVGNVNKHAWEVQFQNVPFSTFVAFFRHPSRGWLERDWERIILPTIDAIRTKMGR
jgi:hypothetical protein